MRSAAVRLKLETCQPVLIHPFKPDRAHQLVLHPHKKRSIERFEQQVSQVRRQKG